MRMVPLISDGCCIGVDRRSFSTSDPNTTSMSDFVWMNYLVPEPYVTLPTLLLLMMIMMIRTGLRHVRDVRPNRAADFLGKGRHFGQ